MLDSRWTQYRMSSKGTGTGVISILSFLNFGSPDVELEELAR